ncbi:hypothetical protein IEQ34_017003 [Dendrobium chrysotoxum]|uniref:Uncharacterized protein n=1 Tax=Dendrobium chrysotoxum TaxID=161865 RepID=A0AAV7GGW2_DENCH|nr:hypothetical protein IEQ34_017003 [Dendrobium chrysotoxum]
MLLNHCDQSSNAKNGTSVGAMKGHILKFLLSMLGQDAFYLWNINEVEFKPKPKAIPVDALPYN